MSNPIPDVKNPPPKEAYECHCGQWKENTKLTLGHAMDRALMYAMHQIFTAQRGEMEWDDKNGRFILSLRPDSTDAMLSPYLKDADEIWIITKPCTLPEGGGS